MNDEHGQCQYAQQGAWGLDCHCDRQCVWARAGAYLAVCGKPDGEEPEIYEVIEAPKWTA